MGLDNKTLPSMEIYHRTTPLRKLFCTFQELCPGKVVQYGGPVPNHLPPQDIQQPGAGLQKDAKNRNSESKLFLPTTPCCRTSAKPHRAGQITHTWGDKQHPTALIAQFKQHQLRERENESQKVL